MKNNILLAFITVVLFFGIFSFMHPDSAVTLALKKPFTPKSGPAPWPKTEDAALQAFADKFYDSFRHNNVEERRSIVGKVSLECIDKEAKAYFVNELSSANPKLDADEFRVRDNGKQSIRNMPNFLLFPETPDTTADIAWTELDGGKDRHLFYRIAVKKENNQYFQVIPCEGKKAAPTDAAPDKVETPQKK